MTVATPQNSRCLFRTGKTITLKRAKRAGKTRKLLMIGIAVQKQGNRLRLLFVTRRLEQIRVN